MWPSEEHYEVGNLIKFDCERNWGKHIWHHNEIAIVVDVYQHIESTDDRARVILMNILTADGRLIKNLTADPGWALGSWSMV